MSFVFIKLTIARPPRVKRLCLLLATFFFLTAGICRSAENPSSHKTKDAQLPPLKIAASIDNTPFHFTDEKGRAVGMLVDLWRLWSRKTDRKIEFISLPWARTLELVRAGKADIHAGCFFSSHRDEYLDYANELQDCQTHFFFHDSIYGLNTLSDLKGFQIGVLDNDYAVEFVRRQMPQAALKIYSSHQALFSGVVAGEVKVFICDTPTALYFLDKNKLTSRFRYHPARPLYQKPFFAAVRQGNAPLIRLINQGLSRITPKERITIERKWMGKAPAQPKDQLIIGVDQSFPPFSMRSANGDPSGLLVDYWQAWTKKNGRNAVIRLYDRQEAVNALKDGFIDILSIFPSTTNIQNWAQESAPIYRLDWYLYRLRPKGGPAQFSPRTPFKDKKLGVLKGSRVGEWLAQKAPESETVEFNATDQMILAAEQKKIHGFLATPQEMSVLPSQMGVGGDFARTVFPLIQTPITPVIRRYNPGLIQIIDTGFERLSQSEKGEVEAKWLSDPHLRIYGTGSSGIQLSDSEEGWVNAHKLSDIPIRLGIHPGLPPFEFMGEDNTYQGMVSDVVSVLGQRLGLSFKPVPPPWAANVDAVPAAFSFLPEKKEMAYTRPYMSFPRVIITRTQFPLITGMMDMTGKTLACIKSDPAFGQITPKWPGIKLHPVTSVKEGLVMVLQGRADGYLGNLARAGYQIQANNFTQLKVAAAAAMDNDDLVFAVKKNNPELLSILNKGIDSITDREMNLIRRKWFTVRFDQGSDLAFIKTMVRRIAFGVLAVFCLVLFWNRMIRRREERFKCLTEHGTDIIQAFSAEGRLVYASPSHTGVLGYPLKHIKNKPVFDLIHPEDVAGFKLMLDRLRQTGGTATQVYRIRHFKGHDIFFESHCMDLTENKAIKAFVINGRDITEALKTRKEIERARESAEAANRKKSDFLAGLSHEIRTPLNAILGMTEMTLKSRLTPSQDQNLSAVLSAARHLKAVISDILDFSTIEAGKMKVFQKNFRMDTLLENLAHIWQSEAATKGLEFIVEKDDKIPAGVRSDPVRLNQILTNLLSNAVKFTPNGQITLKVTIADSPEPETKDPGPASLVPGPFPFDADPKSGEKRVMHVSFEVKDTGIGIKTDHLEKIFDRFTQAQGSITREYGGTGLGLSLCREMALMLGGNIGVKSRPGEGSRFTLTLPLIVLPYPAEDAPITMAAPLLSVSQLTLLLAEDDPVNQAVFREMIAPFNCRIIQAKNGEQALERLKSHTVDMVFMDIEMPRMDGLTATRNIRAGRAGERNRGIPIIAMTAHVLDEYRTRTKAAGMDEFIPKPVEYKELLHILNKYVPQSKTGAKQDTKLDCPIDRDKALAALDGNETLLKKIHGIFISETPELIRALGSALISEDAEALTLAAHTLKGAGARIYATHAVKTATDLEHLARQPHVLLEKDGISQAVQETLRAFENVIDWLKKQQDLK